MANLSGHNATVSIGSGYSGASLTNVSVSINGETIDCSDLSSHWQDNAPGIWSWSVTADKNYATEAFLTLAHTAGSGHATVGVAVKNPAGTTIFSGAGYVTAATLTFPKGAATESITITGDGEPSVP